MCVNCVEYVLSMCCVVLCCVLSMCISVQIELIIVVEVKSSEGTQLNSTQLDRHDITT